MKTYSLVYQAGIANVFQVTDSGFTHKRTRVLQASFRSCEDFARGLVEAGCKVDSLQCNMAGDCVNGDWSANLDDAPFSDEFRPVFT